jgi:hypothetical protein
LQQQKFRKHFYFLLFCLRFEAGWVHSWAQNSYFITSYCNIGIRNSYSLVTVRFWKVTNKGLLVTDRFWKVTNNGLLVTVSFWKVTSNGSLVTVSRLLLFSPSHPASSPLLSSISQLLILPPIFHPFLLFLVSLSSISLSSPSSSFSLSPFLLHLSTPPPLLLSFPFFLLL